MTSVVIVNCFVILVGMIQKQKQTTSESFLPSFLPSSAVPLFVLSAYSVFRRIKFYLVVIVSIFIFFLFLSLSFFLVSSKLVPSNSERNSRTVLSPFHRSLFFFSFSRLLGRYTSWERVPFHVKLSLFRNT